MMKPNDFCVNDVKFRCVWGSLTTWDALNEIQKERKDKIVFSGTVEERGEVPVTRSSGTTNRQQII